VAERVYGTLTFAYFKMELWSDNIARCPDFGDYLALINLITALYKKRIIMRISSHPTARMFDQQ
jgi:hypothetical protein